MPWPINRRISLHVLLRQSLYSQSVGYLLDVTQPNILVCRSIVYWIVNKHNERVKNIFLRFYLFFYFRWERWKIIRDSNREGSIPQLEAKDDIQTKWRHSLCWADRHAWQRLWRHISWSYRRQISYYGYPTQTQQKAPTTFKQIYWSHSACHAIIYT